MEMNLRAQAAHVNYELEMLAFAADLLEGGRWSSPMTSRPSGNYGNMALECFLLHFRNLRAFLCPALQRSWPDDITALVFLKPPSSPLDEAAVAALGYQKDRLDKMLAHLSTKRDHFIANGNHEWPVGRMFLDMVTQFEVFLSKLSPEHREWFPPAEDFAKRKARAIQIAGLE